MDTKLSKLDSTEKMVYGLTGKITHLGEKVQVLEVKMQDIERSRVFDSKAIEELSAKQTEIDTHKDSVKAMEKERKQCDDLSKEFQNHEFKNSR